MVIVVTRTTWFDDVLQWFGRFGVWLSVCCDCVRVFVFGVWRMVFCVVFSSSFLTEVS